jgi:hypothetical protein
MCEVLEKRISGRRFFKVSYFDQCESVGNASIFCAAIQRTLLMSKGNSG